MNPSGLGIFPFCVEASAAQSSVSITSSSKDRFIPSVKIDRNVETTLRTSWIGQPTGAVKSL
jgi:hypothetical protein